MDVLPGQDREVGPAWPIRNARGCDQRSCVLVYYTYTIAIITTPVEIPNFLVGLAKRFAP